MSLSGKVTIITGASSGIGAGTAQLFGSLGAKINLIGRNEENLKAILNLIIDENPGSGSDLIYTVADVTIESEVERIIQVTLEKFGKIDILINNAGILRTGSIEETSLSQYDLVMATNVRSVYQMTMLAVPELIKSKGSIVNVSSVNGIRSFPGVLAYNISKAAIDQFTRCVALELAAKGVRCNSVNPGVIITDIHRRGGMDDDTYAKFLKHCKSTHALGRPGEVVEVANAIAFLCSDKASFTTGTSFPIDGGRHIMTSPEK